MKLHETIRAAFVIARRDFSATVLSKTFLLFLLGPLFPLLIGIVFGGISAKVATESEQRLIAVVATPEEFGRFSSALKDVQGGFPGALLLNFERVHPDPNGQALVDRLLRSNSPPFAAVLSGGLDAPRLIGSISEDGALAARLRLVVDVARTKEEGAGRPLEVVATQQTPGTTASIRMVTARVGQGLLFLLTILLAGMLLSQLIEEKSNKVIEVLAAAVPVDAIFLGKLFAMLATSLVGIAVWGTAAIFAIGIWGNGGLAALPAPAVGWPAFIALVLVYFSMSYLLIGATFLGIGAQASTAREVQILSMPVTMGQVVLFGFAAIGVGRPHSPEAIAAAVFPLSSPYAMLARAAELPSLWPHLLALVWQVLWVALILKVAAAVFRRSVLKSGPSRRWPWQRRKAAT